MPQRIVNHTLPDIQSVNSSKGIAMAGEGQLIDRYIRVNPQTRRYETQHWRREVFPYWMYVDLNYADNTTIAINANGTATQPAIFKFPHASLGLDDGLGNPFLIDQIVFQDSTDGTSSANFTVHIKDRGDGTQLSNQPIHINNIAGTAQLSGLLSEPLMMPSRHTLVVDLNKLSNSPSGATTMRMFFCGQMFWTWGPSLLAYPEDRATLQALVRKYLTRRQYVYPFFMTTDTPVTLTASQTTEYDSYIGDDGHFEATHIVSNQQGNYEMEILNPETKQSLTNGKFHVSAAVGTAQTPQILAVPWLIPAGKRLRWRLNDLSAASNVVVPCLRGRKIRGPLKDWEQIKRDTEIPAHMQVHQGPDRVTTAPHQQGRPAITMPAMSRRQRARMMDVNRNQ